MSPAARVPACTVAVVEVAPPIRNRRKPAGQVWAIQRDADFVGLVGFHLAGTEGRARSQLRAAGQHVALFDAAKVVLSIAAGLCLAHLGFPCPQLHGCLVQTRLSWVLDAVPVGVVPEPVADLNGGRARTAPPGRPARWPCGRCLDRHANRRHRSHAAVCPGDCRAR